MIVWLGYLLFWPTSHVELNLSEQYAHKVTALHHLDVRDDCDDCLEHYLLTPLDLDVLSRQLAPGAGGPNSWIRNASRHWTSPSFSLFKSSKKQNYQYWHFHHFLSAGSLEVTWHFSAPVYVYFGIQSHQYPPAGLIPTSTGTVSSTIPLNNEGGRLHIPSRKTYIFVRVNKKWGAPSEVFGHVVLDVHYNLLALDALRTAGIGSYADWPPAAHIRKAVASGSGAEFPCFIHQAPEWHKSLDFTRLYGGDAFQCWSPGRNAFWTPAKSPTPLDRPGSHPTVGGPKFTKIGPPTASNLTEIDRFCPSVSTKMGLVGVPSLTKIGCLGASKMAKIGENRPSWGEVAYAPSRIESLNPRDSSHSPPSKVTQAFSGPQPGHAPPEAQPHHVAEMRMQERDLLVEPNPRHSVLLTMLQCFWLLSPCTMSS